MITINANKVGRTGHNNNCREYFENLISTKVKQNGYNLLGNNKTEAIFARIEMTLDLQATEKHYCEELNN